jgi:hypothetical protein
MDPNFVRMAQKQGTRRSGYRTGHEQAYGHSVLGGSALAALQDETGASRRIDPVRMATADVNLRAGKSAKSDQAWKYPGYNIQRAPNLTLGDNEYWDPKELPAAMPRRLQESNFKITINTNRKFEGNLEGLAIRAMTKAWADICDDPDLFASILKFGPAQEDTGLPSQALFANDNAADVIKTKRCVGAAEVGDYMSRVHLHGHLNIEHYSQLQINIPMLQYNFRELYNEYAQGNADLMMNGLPYIWVGRSWQRNWLDIYSQYLMKNMTASTEREQSQQKF